MKKLLLLLVASVTLVLSSATQELSPENEAKKLGLVSYLTHVKAISEAKLLHLASHANYTDPKFQDRVSTFHSSYNMVALSVEKLINQLSVDLIASNRLKLYKSLDEHIKNNKPLPAKFGNYNPVLQEIEGGLSVLLIKTYSSALGGAGFADIVGLIELGHGMITDARDFREKKVQSINTLLKELKLKSRQDLIKPKDATGDTAIVK